MKTVDLFFASSKQLFDLLLESLNSQAEQSTKDGTESS